MANNTVSFIVPVYNSEAYISRCLDSILAQTHSDIEIVCFDDGSRDGSPAILDEYAARFPDKVKVVHQANAGVAVTRNRSLKAVTGAYLTFVDNDDWLDPDFAQRLLGAALVADADVVCSGYRRPNTEGKVILSATPSPDDEWGPYLVEAAWAKLYRTDFVRENSLAFLDTNIDEDLYFSLPAVELARNLTVIPYCGYNWFFNTASVSNTSQRTSSGLRFEETLDALLEMTRERRIALTPLLNHYFTRLIVWFLLYTRKGDGNKASRANLAHYLAWLNENIPGWRRDSIAGLSHPTGDAFANRAAVWLFVRHPRLFSCALWLYGKVA